jgi:hypothetical protein
MRPEIASRKQRQSRAVHLAVFGPNWQTRKLGDVTSLAQFSVLNSVAFRYTLGE